jgi:hypothetical protein
VRLVIWRELIEFPHPCCAVGNLEFFHLADPIKDKGILRGVQDVRALDVVVDSPAFNDALRMSYGEEPMLVQAFIAEKSIEAFDVRISAGLPGRIKCI